MKRSILLLVAFPFVIPLSAATFDSFEEDQLALRYTEGSDHQMRVTSPRMEETAGVKGFITASYTYWIAHEDATRSFRTNDHDFNVPQDEAVRGVSIWPNQKARSGFKVLAGVYVPNEKYSASALYSWFRNRGIYRSYDWEGGLPIWSMWPSRQDFRGGDQLDINLQSLRLALSTTFSPTPRWSVDPFFGLFTAMTRQKYIVFSARNNINDEVFFIHHQRWWGSGPQIGIRDGFAIVQRESCDTKLEGELSVANLFTRTLTNYRGMTEQTPQQVRQWFTSKIWAPEPVIQAMLGLTHEHRFFSDRRLHVKFGIHWELQTYFFQNNMGRHGASSETRGALAVQGLTADFGAMF